MADLPQELLLVADGQVDLALPIQLDDLDLEIAALKAVLLPEPEPEQQGQEQRPQAQAQPQEAMQAAPAQEYGYFDCCPIPGCSQVTVCHQRYVVLGPRKKLYQLIPGGLPQPLHYRDCAMVAHQMEAHGRLPAHRCPSAGCNKPHGSRDLLWQHLPKHLFEEQHKHYRCPICDQEGRPQKVNKTKDNVRKHYQLQHPQLYREWLDGRISDEVAALGPFN